METKLKRVADGVYTYGDFTIERKAAGTRYPRNGNVGNPTPIYSWELRQNAKLVGTTCTRRGAVEIAETKV